MHDFHTHFIPNDVLNWLKENKNTVNAEWIKKDNNNHLSVVPNPLKVRTIPTAVFRAPAPEPTQFLPCSQLKLNPGAK